MATTHIYLKNLHFDHKLWLNEVKFYKEEVSLFKNHLAEVVSRNTQQEVLAQAEHFQNQFIRQHEVIDELAHDIRVREDALVLFAKENEVAIEHRYFDDQQADHAALQERVEIFKKIYTDLKTNFMAYLSKWM